MKRSREVGLIVESTLDSDLRERHLSGCDEESCSLQAKTQDKLMRRHSYRRAKEPRKVKWTYACTSCEGNQRQVFVDL